jgi:hypothetical protein
MRASFDFLPTKMDNKETLKNIHRSKQSFLSSFSTLSFKLDGMVDKERIIKMMANKEI